MKIIRVTNNQLNNEGLNGLYFRISKRKGVKIAKDSGYVSPKLNLNSKKNQKIIKETTIGILAASATNELILVRYKSKYYLGILQNHITGKSVQGLDVSKIKKSLNAKKIIHSDLHHGNLIVNKKGIHVIDFDPALSYFVGEKSTYYTVKNRLIKKFKSL